MAPKTRRGHRESPEPEASEEASHHSQPPPQGSHDREEEVNQTPEDVMRNFMNMVGRLAPTTAKKDPIFELQKMGAEKFSGESWNPSKAESWLKSINRVLRLLKCSPEDKVRCLDALLTNQALDWWESRTSSMAPEDVTWEYFEKQFERDFVGETFKNEMRVKFMKLKQGNKSVDQYYEEFTRFGKYAQSMISTDADKRLKFMEGLSKEVYKLVATHRCKTFDKLLEKARQAERSLNRPSDDDDDRDDDKGKKSEGKSSGVSKKFKGSKSSNSSFAKKGSFEKRSEPVSASVANTGGSSVKRTPMCDLCGNYHYGECRKAKGLCFGCGSKDHFVRDCPEAKDVTPSSTPTQYSRPSGGRGRGYDRGSGRGNSGGRGQGSNAPTNKSGNMVNARTYVMRAQDEAEDADVNAGKFRGRNFYKEGRM